MVMVSACLISSPLAIYPEVAGAKTLSGTSRADNLTGTAKADTIRGREGGDTIRGAGGPDELRGDGGPDTLYGGVGDDRVFGSSGRDELFAGAGRDAVSGGSGDDYVNSVDTRKDAVNCGPGARDVAFMDLDDEINGDEIRSLAGERNVLGKVASCEHVVIAEAAEVLAADVESGTAGLDLQDLEKSRVMRKNKEGNLIVAPELRTLNRVLGKNTPLSESELDEVLDIMDSGGSLVELEKKLESFGEGRELAPIKPSGQRIVEEAKSWLGTPYKLGGPDDATREGIDCSGLTMRVMEEFGVSLPDGPVKQFERGEPSDRKPGDLVFFTDGGDKIVNVGVMTADDTVISANKYKGEVSETPFKYFEGYRGARDML